MCSGTTIFKVKIHSSQYFLLLTEIHSALQNSCFTATQTTNAMKRMLVSCMAAMPGSPGGGSAAYCFYMLNKKCKKRCAQTPVTVQHSSVCLAVMRCQHFNKGLPQKKKIIRPQLAMHVTVPWQNACSLLEKQKYPKNNPVVPHFPTKPISFIFSPLLNPLVPPNPLAHTSCLTLPPSHPSTSQRS